MLGDGEADPREPPQDYDERGRPVNAETKRINRNIVRSHNEVMHVIGVAEPDSLITAESESDNQLIQQHLEDMLGRKLWDPARVLGALGVWGAEPLRQRAFVGVSGRRSLVFLVITNNVALYTIRRPSALETLPTGLRAYLALWCFVHRYPGERRG